MYQDTYVEQIVKKVLTKRDYTVKNILMTLTIFFGLATVFAVHFICLILFIVCVILFYWKQSQMETEYEYLYVGGSMEIDRVIRQSKRKQALAMDLSEMLVLAPEGSQKALAYDHGQMSVMRFVSGDPTARIYVIIAHLKKKNRQVKIYFEPKEELLEAMHNHCPDRVFQE